jgi:hypothetical protein
MNRALQAFAREYLRVSTFHLTQQQKDLFCRMYSVPGDNMYQLVGRMRPKELDRAMVQVAAALKREGLTMTFHVSFDEERGS